MYQVKIYKGDYSSRQNQANNDKCICYCEHHFNATPGGNYTVVIVPSNASDTGKKWGKMYAQMVSNAFGTPMGGSSGILIGGYGGRGDSNVKQTNMPSILLEPLFADNPKHAVFIKSENGQNKLATILVDTIKKIFPQGGLVGFSIGHKYKSSKPKDRGASVYGGGTEADYAEIVLNKAKLMLESGSAVVVETAPVVVEKFDCDIKIVVNDKLAFTKHMSSVERIEWNEEQKKLYIYGEE